MLTSDSETNTGVLLAYEEYVDFSGEYVFSFSSPVLSFGDPSRLKIVKQVDYTVVAGAGDAEAEALVNYYGYRDRQLSKRFTVIGGQGTEEYFEFEYNDGSVYGTGETVIKSYRYNAALWENVQIGFKMNQRELMFTAQVNAD